MDKTLFEKLTLPDKALTLQQSVINNITKLLHFGGFLDDEIGSNNSGNSLSSSIYPNSLSAIVDNSGADKEEFKAYQSGLEKLVLRFEPRVKSIKISGFKHQGMQVGCNLKIELHDGEFEQHFVFNQG